jgi:hypothetical protein
MTTQTPPDPEHEPSEGQTREGFPVEGYSDRTIRRDRPVPDSPTRQEGEGYQPAMPAPDAEEESEADEEA